MRKLLLSAILALASLSVGAQEFSNSEPYYTFEYVPAIFTCNNETLILDLQKVSNQDYKYTILNGEQKGTSFYGCAAWIKFYDHDNMTAAPDGPFFSQNIFNDDEHIEWIQNNTIHSSNGTLTALPIPADSEIRAFFKINNKYYLHCIDYAGGIFSLYLIKSETASIEKVPADAPEARLVYSLSGRRQSEMQQGVNIVTGGENGPRKVLKR